MAFKKAVWEINDVLLIFQKNPILQLITLAKYTMNITK